MPTGLRRLLLLIWHQRERHTFHNGEPRIAVAVRIRPSLTRWRVDLRPDSTVIAASEEIIGSIAPRCK